MVGIEIEAEGVGRAAMLIESMRAALDQAGNKIRGVDLHAKKRLESESDNVEVARHLMDSARDFFSVSESEATEIAEAFATEMQRMMDHLASVNDKAASSMDASRQATQAVAKAYTSTMKKYAAIVGTHIDSQMTASGQLRPLSEAYAEYKQRKFGFVNPIGVATGQLRENFDPSNSGNIRLHRGVLAG